MKYLLPNCTTKNIYCSHLDTHPILDLLLANLKNKAKQMSILVKFYNYGTSSWLIFLPQQVAITETPEITICHYW